MSDTVQYLINSKPVSMGKFESFLSLLEKISRTDSCMEGFNGDKKEVIEVALWKAKGPEGKKYEVLLVTGEGRKTQSINEID